ncbi:MAG: alpha/beta hydrolase-fold protein [Byssovorax sp.]
MNNSMACCGSVLGALLISACGSGDTPGTTGGAGGKGGAAASTTASSTSTGGGAGGGVGGSGGGGTGGSVVDPVGTEGDGDIVIGPNYTDAPEISKVAGVPQGKSFSFKMLSKNSAFYTGHDPTLKPALSGDFTRNVEVVIPAAYVDGTDAPFMVVQDARDHDPIVNTINNLIADAAHPFPPVIAIFVANGGNDSIGSERGLEYDTMSEKYQQFIDAEVLPAIPKDSNVKAAYPALKLTSDPEGRGAYGCSSGGAAALTMGWFGGDTYRRIITYSGTFVDQQNPVAPTEVQYPNGAWEYTDQLIVGNPKKPLRVFQEAGEHDNGYMNDEASHHNWVMANQRVAAALKAKGYHYRFVFAKGAGHCDAGPIRQTIPDTLRWMWRGYPVK